MALDLLHEPVGRIPPAAQLLLSDLGQGRSACTARSDHPGDCERRAWFLGPDALRRTGKHDASAQMPEQQRAVERIVRLRRAGKPLRAIAQALRTDGINLLSHVGVKRVVLAAEAQRLREGKRA